MKTCTRCMRQKSPEDFNRSKKASDGRQSRCRECQREVSAEYYQANAKKRDAQIKTTRRRRRKTDPKGIGKVRQGQKYRQKYGITLEQVEAQKEAQGGICPICLREPTRWHVDHCHTSGAVRGVICDLCNPGLGCFRDDIESLLRAIEYLKDPPGISTLYQAP